MDHRTPPPEHLIAEALRQVAQLVLFAQDLLLDRTGAAKAVALRGVLASCIAPAEAILRRAIYLLASTLPPEPVRTRTIITGAAFPARSGNDQPPAPAKPRTPLFRLTEPAARAPRPATSRTNAPSPTARAVPRAPDLAALAEKVQSRLTALQAASGNPQAAARRLLRRLARTRPTRRPLSEAAPPGITRMRMDSFKIFFAQINTASLQAWPRLSNTS